MCNKAVGTYPSAIQFVPECFKYHEICDKAVDTCPLVGDSVPGQYLTQEICDKVVSKEPFLLKYCLDRYDSRNV